MAYRLGKKMKHSVPSLSDLLADRPDFSLEQVLKDPILLNSFENYLTQNFAQENLLFIEAMNQLRYEHGSSQDTEAIINR
jgi:hypothetical protein